MSDEPVTKGANEAAPAQLQARLFATPAATGLPANLPECSVAAEQKGGR
ncbi:MAG: hypothetical protein ABI689_07790 [Thermoanaerobaculia bacterium]